MLKYKLITHGRIFITICFDSPMQSKFIAYWREKLNEENLVLYDAHRKCYVHDIKDFIHMSILTEKNNIELFNK